MVDFMNHPLRAATSSGLTAEVSAICLRVSFAFGPRPGKGFDLLVWVFAGGRCTTRGSCRPSPHGE